MDLIDKKILKIIGMNSRASVNYIAKSIGKSKETVNYRLNRMIKDKTILSFYTNINGGKLGFYYYKILLKYKTMNSETEKVMLAFLKKNKNMVWVGNCDGEYQLMISLLVRDLGELNNFLNSFLGKFGNYLYDKEIMQITSFDVLNENYLDVNVGEKSSMREDVTCSKEDVAKIDLKILRILAGDARIKLIDMSKKINMTAEAISYRIKNLVNRGIISNFKTRIDYSKLGYLYYQVLLSLNDLKVKQKIIDKFTNHANCVSIIEFIGKYDLQLEVVVKNVEELRDILDDLRKDHGKQIHAYTPLTIYKEHGAVVFPMLDEKR
ncbi:Lrp/AsnC family transcriptional regulator [Candidatus Pacearchaeota archaeon]|nr:Lrp/AsnC family transcriptional regulator [Candidatus Pacearchaeota archaeon]